MQDSLVLHILMWMDSADTPQRVRAEEIIVTVLGRKKRLESEGHLPTRVILTIDQYRKLQDYRARLGDLPDAQFEYLTRYELFGLELCVEPPRTSEDEPEVRVE